MRPQAADTFASLDRLEAGRFRNIVRHLLQFISIRQFPAGERGLPAPTRSRWWIPTAVRVLALLSKRKKDDCHLARASFITLGTLYCVCNSLKLISFSLRLAWTASNICL